MLSPTLIRRYTPPTCSLEVVAKTSALSQWTGNPVIKELKFELSLDDPRLITENRILLTGDRQQLEDLAEVVTNYVQNFLQQTNPVFDFAPTQNIYTYQTQGAIANNLQSITRPQLETKGLLSHQLHLGRLANDISGQTIQLSVTQLYDLANALESYSSDMVALPTLTARRNRKTAMRWGAVAASFLLVVGISKTALDLQQANQVDTAAIPENTEAMADAFDQQQVVRPNLHSSYSFATVPELDEQDPLAAKKADPSVVSLAPIPPGQPPAPRPQSNASPAPVTARPKPANNPPSSNTKTDTTKAPTAPRPQPPAIASNPSDVIIPRQVAAAPETPADFYPAAPASASAPTSAPGSTDTSEETTARSSPSLDTTYTFSETGSSQETVAAIPTGDRRQQTQQYFDQRWQTPAGLDETLEYRLQIDQAGTLQTVTPLGKGAELYQRQLAYLAIGNKIAAPTENPPQIIRLVLDPDGTVQTFEE